MLNGNLYAPGSLLSGNQQRRTLHRALDASLKRMNVENVDLYQLHASDMKTPMEETLGFLADAVQAGKIHYIGISNFTGWELQLFVSIAKAMGAPCPSACNHSTAFFHGNANMRLCLRPSTMVWACSLVTARRRLPERQI
ncbi:aldo/keto reductase [Novosphingobium resinovorum]